MHDRAPSLFTAKCHSPGCYTLSYSLLSAAEVRDGMVMHMQRSAKILGNKYESETYFEAHGARHNFIFLSYSGFNDIFQEYIPRNIAT